MLFLKLLRRSLLYTGVILSLFLTGCIDLGSSDKDNPLDVVDDNNDNPVDEPGDDPSDDPIDNPSDDPDEDPTDDPVDEPTDDGYVLVWSDEFNKGSRPDPKKWNLEKGYGHENSGWGNDEWQLYTDSAENSYIKDGSLVISAQCLSGNCASRDGSVTSARLNTNGKFTVKYGKVQARIKTPAGQGTWSAFWMLGDNFNTDGWPKSGEIDIMEMHYKHSDVNSTQAAAHWWDDKADEPGHTLTFDSKSFDSPLTDDYHVYEVEWDSNRILGKIDDVIYYIQPIDQESMSEFLNDFFLILNVAVGGTLGGDEMTTSWPQNMYVDWVRVYQKANEAKKTVFSEPGDIDTDNLIRIIDSNEWWGNDVVSNPASTAAAPLDGDHVLASDFALTGANAGGNAGWGGMVLHLTRQDWSKYSDLVFSLDTSAMAGLDDIEVKIEDTRGGDFARAVKLVDYTPETSGNWSTYTIPLKDFPGVDVSDVFYLGFFNPVDVNDALLGGTLYFDDIHLIKNDCTTDGAVALDAESYAESSALATVSVKDLCAANKYTVVMVSNGSESVGVSVKLNSAGDGSAPILFGETLVVENGNDLTVTLVDSFGAERSVSATITGVEGLVGDTNDDELVVLIASDAEMVVDLVPEVDYAAIDTWGSGTVITNPYEADADISPVLELIPGEGWGASTAAIAFTGFAPGFSTAYATLNFRVKNMPTGDVFIKFASGGGAELEKAFALDTYGQLIDGLTGWYKVTIPLSDFPDAAVYTEFAIMGGFGNGGPFLLTDIYFADGASMADPEAAEAPVDEPVEDADAKIYLLATDSANLDWAGDGTDFSIADWGSGSVYNGAFSDADFDPVFEVAPGWNWGAETAAVAFTGIEVGFATGFESLNFKVKNLPTGDVVIKFASGEGPATETAFALADYGTPIEGTDGWTEVSIPMSSFPDQDAYFEFAIMGGWGNGGTFLLTDVYLERLGAGEPADESDPEVYLLATDSSKIDWAGDGTDFSIADWGSGSVYNGAFSDADFDPVFEVAPGWNWGAETAAVAFTGIEVGFATQFSSLDFKIKNLPTGDVVIKFASGEGPATETAFALADYGTALEGTDGWIAVSIPLSSFPEQAAYYEFAIMGGWGNGGTFLLTDVGLIK